MNIYIFIQTFGVIVAMVGCLVWLNGIAALIVASSSVAVYWVSEFSAFHSLCDNYCKPTNIQGVTISLPA